MILDAMILHNFRPYYGTQKILFSKNKHKNITVIHGGNGSGKTTLLNAFSWCFYNELELDEPEKIVNHRAIAESKIGEKIEAYVQIQFSDNNKDYTITRKVFEERINESETKIVDVYFSVEYIDETGKTVTPRNPQNTIEQILPKEMKGYFFLDGERIDNLSKKDGSKDVKKAIKSIMGIEVLNRSINHLDTISKRFMNELKQFGNIKTQQLIKELQEIEEEIKKIESEYYQLDKNRESIEKEKETVVDKLRSLEGAKELQKRRDELERKKMNLEAEIEKKREEIKNICSDFGYLAFAKDAIIKTQSILEEKRKKGEIPSGIKEQFVDDLLKRKVCICGCKLIPGTSNYLEVSKWKKKSNSKAIEDVFIKTNGYIRVLEKERIDLFENIRRLKEEKDKLSRERKEVKEELDEIGSKLDDKDNEEIKDLERKRRELETELKNTNQRIGEMKNKINSLEKDKKEKEEEISKSEDKENKALLARKRLNYCKEASECLKKVYNHYALIVRYNLQKKIHKVFSKFFIKDYWIEINDDYELNMYKNVDSKYKKTVAMSQGERQVASLSFIGSLVDIAREQYEKEKKNYFRGGIYPIVMDSSFGTLEFEHRENISKGIHELAHQVVIFVSDSQWAGPVEENMKHKVGKEYSLLYYNRKKNPSLKYEFTEIKEGKI